mmetsp:Transcript_10392/g.19724  ORF Transcript_10392/g.19724 Transcript_10392/m.19724 type:complete len:267 (+) Transcript_10392:317-1117(+)
MAALCPDQLYAQRHRTSVHEFDAMCMTRLSLAIGDDTIVGEPDTSGDEELARRMQEEWAREGGDALPPAPAPVPPSPAQVRLVHTRAAAAACSDEVIARSMEEQEHFARFNRRRPSEDGEGNHVLEVRRSRSSLSAQDPIQVLQQLVADWGGESNHNTLAATLGLPDTSLMHLRRHSHQVDIGASQMQIDQLPIHKFCPHSPNSTHKEGEGEHDSDKHQCSVCLDDFQPQAELRTLPCMHIFHVECIDEWLTKSATCPICKHNIGF